MEDFSRPSSESLHDSESFFLSDFEKSGGFSNDARARRRLPWTVIVPWVLCLVLFVGILVQASILVSPSRGYWSRNELGSLVFIHIVINNSYPRTGIAQREVPAITKQIRFTGGLRYNESKQLYRQIEPGIPNYAGVPTPEIDAAWHEIISSMYIGL
jgi:hypothetical protein